MISYTSATGKGQIKRVYKVGEPIKDGYHLKDLKKNKVRFPSANGGYADIHCDGAFICMRIVDKFNLSVGDEFTVSPYGSDQKYTLKVAGIIRSISENIINCRP